MKWTPAEVLPHSAPMILIDEIIQYTPDQMIATLTVPRDGLFNDAAFNGDVPAWVGIEYMAQTIAAHAGWKARLGGCAPSIGFLLGTRKFETNVSAFCVGTQLVVTVQEVMQAENGMAVFDCQINAEGIEVTARINGFQPKDASIFLNLKSEDR